MFVFKNDLMEFHHVPSNLEKLTRCSPSAHQVRSTGPAAVSSAGARTVHSPAFDGGDVGERSVTG